MGSDVDDTEDFWTCDLCDKRSDSYRGARLHVAKKHPEVSWTNRSDRLTRHVIPARKELDKELSRQYFEGVGIKIRAREKREQRRKRP